MSNTLAAAGGVVFEPSQQPLRLLLRQRLSARLHLGEPGQTSDGVNGEVSDPRVTGIRPIFVAALAAAMLPACTQSCDAATLR
jgi:hypothetical protein